jgi:putative addiction module component (TIGR02574 family)
MSKTPEAVLADALSLDVKGRAELAAQLLAGLEGPADRDAEAAWTTEIERRVQALEAGTETLESWEAVRHRIETDILRR